MPKQLAALDGTFRALADATRRAIVERLAAGPASVSELAAPFPHSLPAIHQHLALLEDCGLVASTKAGRVRTCRLETAALDRIVEWVDARRATWERRLDALARDLAGESPPRTRRAREERG